MPKNINLVGQNFGYLMVNEKTELRKHQQVLWDCTCSCGKHVLATTHDLTSGRINNCGCMTSKLISLSRSKTNRYEDKGDYYIGYTFKNEPFYIDKDDYDLVKDYCWRLRKDGYLDAKIRDGTDKRVLMHNLIMDSKFIDHRG